MTKPLSFLDHQVYLYLAKVSDDIMNMIRTLQL